MKTVKISGTGIYSPPFTLTTQKIEEMYGKDIKDWMVEKLGIKVKKISESWEAASDLAKIAGEEALKNAKIDPLDIDLLIVATDTPDFFSPATSSVVQAKLGLKNSATFDVNCACAAFVTALDIGTRYLLTEESMKKALIIGTYAMTKFLNWQDKITAPMFSDGAGAVVLEKVESDEKGFISSKLIADGTFWDYLGLYLGSGAVPTPEYIQTGRHFVRYNKRYPDVNFEMWPKLIKETVEKGGFRTEDIDFVIFTQVRKITIEDVMKALNLPMEKTHMVMDKYGYTGSACIPMALNDALNEGKIKKGDLVVFCASGGGYAMACYALKWL
ncbi:MAG: 3-oxoacyl-ACP synthase III family protein [Caldisericia bacterium]